MISIYVKELKSETFQKKLSYIYRRMHSVSYFFKGRLIYRCLLQAHNKFLHLLLNLLCLSCIHRHTVIFLFVKESTTISKAAHWVFWSHSQSFHFKMRNRSLFLPGDRQHAALTVLQFKPFLPRSCLILGVKREFPLLNADSNQVGSMSIFHFMLNELICSSITMNSTT